MSKMSELDTVVSDLRSAAATINSVADTLLELFGGKETEPEAPAEAPKPALTLPEVRAVLAEKSRAGYTAQVKALLREYGAEKLSALDPSVYERLLKDAEAIGNG